MKVKVEPWMDGFHVFRRDTGEEIAVEPCVQLEKVRFVGIDIEGYWKPQVRPCDVEVKYKKPGYDTVATQKQVNFAGRAIISRRGIFIGGQYGWK